MTPVPPAALTHGFGPSASAAALENRILILAPTANDARLAAGFITQAGIEVVHCKDVVDLCCSLVEGCGVVLLAQEALDRTGIELIIATLQRQPSWSDIPIILVSAGIDRAINIARPAGVLGRSANVTLIERPFRPETLLSLLEAALRSRRRQYEVRDLVTKIAASEARFRQILEQSVVGLAETDLTGRLTLVNQRYCEILGRPREELLQCSLADVAHPDDRDATRQGVSNLVAGRVPSYITERRLLRVDGAVVWVHKHVSPVCDANGAIRGLAVAVADITERKRAEEQLGRARDEAIAASRAKDDFLASLSHELRTPLNPVLLIASEAARNPALPAHIAADFDTIARNVALEARLIDDLLDLTRITRGKLKIERRVTSLHATIADAIATVEADFSAKGVRLLRQFTTREVFINGDATRLQQVFWNLLKNAVKFTPAGGAVTIATRINDDGGKVEASIIDTGIGMTATEVERIFDPFVQGNHALQRAHQFGGLGLGLTISRRLVDLHDGRISAHSAGAGLGSSFRVELPLVPAGARAIAPVRPEAEPDSHSTPSRRGRVLLVDDHLATRSALAHLLNRRNFDVVPAGSLAEALDVARHGRIDLIVSDIGLPDGTGYDLMEQFGKKNGVKGIAITGYGMDQDIALSERAGFAAHLTKPVRVEALDGALETVLAAHTA